MRKYTNEQLYRIGEDIHRLICLKLMEHGFKDYEYRVYAVEKGEDIEYIYAKEGTIEDNIIGYSQYTDDVNITLEKKLLKKIDIIDVSYYYSDNFNKVSMKGNIKEKLKKCKRIELSVYFKSKREDIYIEVINDMIRNNNFIEYIMDC